MQRLTFIALSLAVAGLTTGCTVGSPETAFGQGKTTKGDMAEQHGSRPDGGAQDLGPPLTAPQPTTFAASSAWDSVPLHGTASPPNSAVIITAMDGSMTSADVDGSGSFCADMALQRGKTNTFQLKTHDNNTGEESESITVQITQTGQPSTGQQVQGSNNAALGGSATSYQIGNNGTAAAQQIVDGDNGTFDEQSYANTWNASYPAPAFVVQLPQAAAIGKIVAVLPADCIGDGKLTLAYSAQSSPATPGPGAMGWITTNATKSSDGRTWSASFNAATANYIAVWWNDVSFSNTFDQGGCGSQGFTYGMAELQAWTVAGVQQPPQVAPMCGF